MDNNNNMEYRITLEKQNKLNDQVTELILDNCRATQISGLTDEFVNLETLSLINVGLVTLKGFPRLPKLKRLELSDNRLTGGLNLLHGSPYLQHLNISGNRIKELEALEPLREFQDLVNLDLYNCEVTKLDGYRQRVFQLLPNLRSLDGYDRNLVEVPDSDESDDDVSEADNRISRDDNDEDDDENDEDDDDDEDDDSGDEEDNDEEDVESSEYSEAGVNGLSGGRRANEADDDDDDDDDDEDDDEEDDDEEEDSEEGSENSPNASRNISSEAQNSSEAAVVGSVKVGENAEHIENGDDEDDDVYEKDYDAEGSDLKQLERDLGDDDSDDDDFEPTHEPDERDYEIDPEDDADEDADESGANLSASNVSADDSKLRGQKRKREDEGGDEVEEES